PALDVGPVDVYLAEVADSQRQLRKRLHDDLVRERVSVAWNVPPPFDAKGHRERAIAVMRRARLSVHLLDGYAGKEVDGDLKTTYPQEQVRLARDHARSQLIWVKSKPAEVDDSQQVLLDELRNGAGAPAAGHDFQEGTPPSELVQDILAKLRQDRPLPEKPRAVLLDGHVKDAAVVAEVDRFLRDHRIATYVHRPQGDPRRDTEWLTERLRTVGALVVCHGEVDEAWVGSRIAEAFEAVFKRACPFELFCVYLAPPADKDLRIYERFKFLEDQNKFALLRNQHGPPKATTFEPLFRRLGVGGTA
ncbi:MAG: hypothetical protein GY856_14725, partial [bacterium]|nr:hypothetical protein [bacterium]